MALITLSREEGSLSKQIGLALAEKLGYDFISGKTISNELQENYGVTRSQLEKFDEKKPGIMANFTNSYEKYNNTFKLYIFEKLLKNPNCIIMGRGGTFFLKDVPGLLRLRTIGSEDVRVRRLMERYKVDERSAKKMLAHKDLERTEQSKFLYNEIWGKPSSYDLLINTDRLSVDAVCSMVKNLIAELDRDNYKEAQEKKLRELYLAQKAINAVLYDKKISVSFFEVKIDGDKAMVNGSTRTVDVIDTVVNTIKEITGVKEIENNLTMENFTMSYDMGMEILR